VKCKGRKEIVGAAETRLRNGKTAVTGTCITCGVKIFKIIRDPADKGLPPRAV
jgi:hypothetical protein